MGSLKLIGEQEGGTDDHAALTNLDFPSAGHTGFVASDGIAGGQTVRGGLAASEHLTLQSTAHATRGYVRAQDDLQLLSDIVRDSGGNARLALAASSPHLTVTGQTRLTDSLAVGDSDPSAFYGILLDKSAGASQSLLYGLRTLPDIGNTLTYAGVTGVEGTATVTGGHSGANARAVGLSFSAAFYGLASGQYLRGLHAGASQQSGQALSTVWGGYLEVSGSGLGTVSTVYGLQVGGCVKNVTTAYGIYLNQLGASAGGSVTDLYFIRMKDKAAAPPSNKCYGLYIDNIWPSDSFHPLYNAGPDGVNVLASNTQFGSATPSLGGGVGVLGLANATAVPTSNPTGGGVAYAEAGRFKWRRPDGTIDTLGEGAGQTDAYVALNAGSTLYASTSVQNTWYEIDSSNQRIRTHITFSDMTFGNARGVNRFYCTAAGDYEWRIRALTSGNTLASGSWTSAGSAFTWSNSAWGAISENQDQYVTIEVRRTDAGGGYVYSYRTELQLKE